MILIYQINKLRVVLQNIKSTEAEEKVLFGKMIL